MIDSDEDAKRKCTHEIKTLLHRWEQESDLGDEEILECVSDAIDEYYEEDVVEFDSDISVGDDEEMELE